MNPDEVVKAIGLHLKNIAALNDKINHEKARIKQVQLKCPHDWEQIMQGADGYKRCRLCGSRS